MITELNKMAKKTSEENLNLMKQILLLIHSDFCVDTKDVYQHFEIDRKKAYAMLSKLEEVGLISHEEQIVDGKGNRTPSPNSKGHKTVSYAWQAISELNCDNADEAKVIAAFNAKFGIVEEAKKEDPAAPAPNVEETIPAPEKDELEQLAAEGVLQDATKAVVDVDEATAKPKEVQYFHFIRVLGNRIAKITDQTPRSIKFIHGNAVNIVSTDGASWIVFDIDGIDIKKSKVPLVGIIGIALVRAYAQQSGVQNDMDYLVRFQDYCIKAATTITEMVAFDLNRTDE